MVKDKDFVETPSGVASRDKTIIKINDLAFCPSKIFENAPLLARAISLRIEILSLRQFD